MEIAIENDLKFSARRQKRTMALRSRLITELNHLFTVTNNMSSDNNLSNEDVNHSISLTLAQSDSDSQVVDLGSDAQTPGRGLYHGGDTGSHVANPDALSIKSI